MPVPITERPNEPPASELTLAFKIVEYTHDAAMSFLDGFTAVRREQGMGTTTDEQQDLLRAMLLFACAGLDSSAKQMIQDAMPRLATHDDGVREELRRFAANAAPAPPQRAWPRERLRDEQTVRARPRRDRELRDSPVQTLA